MSSSPRTTPKPKRASRPAPTPSGRNGVRPKSDFYVRFWGVRGSIPSPGPNTLHFGGNTPCVEVRAGNELLIFDLGSGARELGESFLGHRKPLNATILLSHYHYDHLQGLPFFSPIFDAQNTFTVAGPNRGSDTVKEVLAGQMVQPYFPVTAEMVFRAKLNYRSLKSGEPLRIGDVEVIPTELNHPGGSMGYRVEFGGRSLVYATDVEHGSPHDEQLAAFAKDCDVLIYDAMYTEDEYLGRRGAPKAGWGHSTWQAAVAAAESSQTKKLVLFHHDPTRDDRSLEAILKQVRKHRKDAVAARESMVIDI